MAVVGKVHTTTMTASSNRNDNDDNNNTNGFAWKLRDAVLLLKPCHLRVYFFYIFCDDLLDLMYYSHWNITIISSNAYLLYTNHEFYHSIIAGRRALQAKNSCSELSGEMAANGLVWSTT